VNWRMGVRTRRLSLARRSAIAGLLVLIAALPLAGREKDKSPYGEGLIVNIPLPVSEVEQVVEDVVQNGVIRGTKEYNKDEFVSGAKAATSSRVFPAWTEGGKVFYKVREQALDPRNFKDSSDVGTLVVRYVVLPQGEKNTVLRIDALFEETFRRIVHQSNGSVESSEYKDIREHIEAIELMKKQNVEAEKERQEQLLKKQNLNPCRGERLGRIPACKLTHPVKSRQAKLHPAKLCQVKLWKNMLRTFASRLCGWSKLRALRSSRRRSTPRAHCNL